jgi:hypothetical protein
MLLCMRGRRTTQQCGLYVNEREGSAKELSTMNDRTNVELGELEKLCIPHRRHNHQILVGGLAARRHC